MKLNNVQIFWIVILGISLLFLFNGYGDSASPDKKTAQVGTDQVVVGVVGTGTSLFFLKRVAVAALAPGLWKVIAWPVVGLMTLLPGIFERALNIFRPQPSISPIVWIIGFVVLIIIVLKMKK